MKKIYCLLGLILLFAACKKDEKPVVMTGEATNIEAYSTDLSGTLVDDYKNDITELGFLIGNTKESLEKLDDGVTKCLGILKGSSITASIDKLIPGTVYYYRTFATTENGMGVGEIEWFRTLADKPVITILPVENIRVTDFVVSARIETYNGAPLTDWGFRCSYGDQDFEILNPTIGDDNIFRGTFEGLNSATTYQVCAYARNDVNQASAKSETLTVTTESHLHLFLSSFASANGVNISMAEVTQGVYYEINDPNHPISSGEWGFEPLAGLRYNEILSFIAKLNNATNMNFRLPTVAEWQAAANDSHAYSGSDNIDEVAWYAGNSGNHAHKVFQLKANEYGLRDMSGNLWEMTATANGDGDSHYICGGSFRSKANDCLISSKGLYPDGSSSDEVGFRLVK